MELQLHTIIDASAVSIFNTWLSSEGHSAMTGGDAEINAVVGDEFSAWDGYISGKNVLITPHSRIVQTWRTTEFTDDEPDSMLEIVFNEKNGRTEVTLIHTNLPEHGEQYRAGWEDHYFVPMKEYFGKEA